MSAATARGPTASGGNWRAWLPVAAYAALIFVLSNRPSLVEQVPLRLRFLGLDRVGHCGEYGLLGWLAARALAANGASPPRRLWLGLALASLYGATDELHQAFVPGRSCQAGDWVADTAGGALGSWLRSVSGPEK